MKSKKSVAHVWQQSQHLITIFILLFSVIPIITRNILPHDMIENLYWGKELQLGYAKHPPLFSWISFFFYKICFSVPESLYILTQLNLLLGFFFIFQISKLIFSDKTKCYASILIFMASACSVFGNEKFNANTILMSLLPAMFLFFIRMMKFKRNIDAIAFGLVSALAFMGKYFALLYIGCIGIFVLCNKQCRNLLKTPLPYIAIAVFLLCISWHIYWICDSGYISIKYALEKSINARSNFFSSFNFLLMQFLFFFSSFWAFSYAYFGKMEIFPEKNKQYFPEEKFILFMTIVPNAVLFFASLIFGMRIGSFWGVNMCMTIGIYLLIINQQPIDYPKLYYFVTTAVIIFGTILFLKLGAIRLLLKENEPVKGIDIQNIAYNIEKDWNTQCPGQLMEIIKTDKPTAALHIYLKSSPSLYDCKHFDLFKIYNRYPYNKNVVVTFLYDRYGMDVEKFRDYYKGNILFENTISVTKKYNVYYAFLNVRPQ